MVVVQAYCWWIRVVVVVQAYCWWIRVVVIVTRHTSHITHHTSHIMQVPSDCAHVVHCWLLHHTPSRLPQMRCRNEANGPATAAFHLKFFGSGNSSFPAVVDTRRDICDAL